jgi:hypothetical protein
MARIERQLLDGIPNLFSRAIMSPGVGSVLRLAQKT